MILHFTNGVSLFSNILTEKLVIYSSVSQTGFHGISLGVPREIME